MYSWCLLEISMYLLVLLFLVPFCIYSFPAQVIFLQSGKFSSEACCFSCSSENVFSLPPFPLKDFCWVWISEFSFSTLKLWFHYFPASIVSTKKSVFLVYAALFLVVFYLYQLLRFPRIWSLTVLRFPCIWCGKTLLKYIEITCLRFLGI